MIAERHFFVSLARGILGSKDTAPIVGVLEEAANSCPQRERVEVLVGLCLHIWPRACGWMLHEWFRCGHGISYPSKKEQRLSCAFLGATFEARTPRAPALARSKA